MRAQKSQHLSNKWRQKRAFDCVYTKTYLNLNAFDVTLDVLMAMYSGKGANGANGHMNHKCLKSGQSSHQRQESQLSATFLNNCNNNPSMDPLVDRTPCGSAELTPHFDESYDTPPYIRWSQDYDYLINDVEGRLLFQKYLKSEGLEQMLDFWAACEGLKNDDIKDKQMIGKLVKVIYKKFVRNSKTIHLSDKVRLGLKQTLTADTVTPQDNDPKYDKHVFDSAQNEVNEQLKGSIYVNFLRSSIYIDYLQFNAFPNSGAVRAASYGTDINDNPSTNDNSSLEDYNTQSNQYYEVLPTVDEESELQTTEESVRRPSNAYLRSQTQNKFQSIPVNPCHNLLSFGSKDTLRRGINKILSERSADNSSVVVTTESHPLSPNHNRVNTAYQSYFRSKSMANPPNPYHVKYATVLPTSARDSELQSISSHSTNESMSCVSGHNGADSAAIKSKKQSLAIKHNARQNSNANTNANNLSLRLRPPTAVPTTATSSPDQFAHELIHKLEEVKKQIDSQESNDKKLAEVLQLADLVPNANKSNPTLRHSSVNPSESSGCRPNKTLKEVLKERVAEHKFELPPDNDQDILDKHFAQVFSETPNETPTDSIGRCVSPPKQHNFRTFDHRMTPSVTSMGNFDATQVGVTVKYSTEQIPYRLTLLGPHITLRKFKQQIPAKRGNWQYYFKRKCDDRDLIDISSTYVLEKITDDNILLPLIDGKIFAELQESN